MTHKNGRQIYLTREEIHHLRDLVELDAMSRHDNIRQASEYEQYGEDYKDEKAQEEKYLELDESLDKKLWYRITPEEAAARNLDLAESESNNG